jgi:N-acyl-D-amino-acid deacylase
VSELDLVIASATVIDGSADAVPHVADIGITGGVIAEVGDLSERARRATVDSPGKVVAPGFIDTHTHVEIASLHGHPDRYAPLRQGVTTTFTGADGFGWVGLDASNRLRAWEDTAAIYGMPIEPLPAWEHPADFVSDLREASPTRVVPMVPHGNLRFAVMGDDPRPAGAVELGAMRDLIDAWMDAGAVGLASGLDYLPGRYAPTEEIIELCTHVAARGGVYGSHLRLHDKGRRDAWKEIGDIGREAGIPIRIAHERIDDEAAAVLEATAEGNDLAFDTYLYPAGCTSLAFHVPAEHLANGIVNFSERLRGDDTMAADLAIFLQEKMAGRPGQRALIAATTSGQHEGRALDELAADWEMTVGEVAVELLRTELPAALLVYVWQAADDSWQETVRRTLADDRSIIASDGVYLGSHPHPRGFGTFARVLGTLARDSGMVSLPRAIHKMSGKPAAAYGLTDRGLIEPGRKADLVVFDPQTVNGTDDYSNPRQEPRGIDLVLIGGVPAHTKGTPNE